MANEKKAYNLLTKISEGVPDGYELTISKFKKFKKMCQERFQLKQEMEFKPNGIWTSGKFQNGENSWSDWLYDEKLYDWFDKKDHYYFALKITNDPKLILEINTLDKLKKFHKKYRVEYHTSKKTIILIDWKAIKNKGYYGVKFTKYYKNFLSTELEKRSEEKAPEYLWYSMLDCACTCVWNSSAIIDIKNIKI